MGTSKFAALAELNGKKGKRRIPVVAPKVGRPAGKRSDEEFKGYTCILRKDTALKAKTILFQRENNPKFDKLDFSELVQMLLEKWVSEQRV